VTSELERDVLRGRFVPHEVGKDCAALCDAFVRIGLAQHHLVARFVQALVEHEFAAAFLMPAEDIADELPDRADWPTLFQLKQKWQVSLAALLMRARILGRMSENNYLTAIKAASARGWRRVEPVPLGAPEQPTCLKHLLETPAGRESLAVLPCDVVDALVTATTI